MRRNPAVFLLRDAADRDDTVNFPEAIPSRKGIVSITYQVGNARGVDASQRSEMEAALTGKKKCMTREQANKNKDGSGFVKFQCRNHKKNKCKHKLHIKTFTKQSERAIRAMLEAATQVREADIGESLELVTDELTLAVADPSRFDVSTVVETMVFGGMHTCNHTDNLKLSVQSLVTFAHMNHVGGFPDVAGKSTKQMESLFRGMGLPNYIKVPPRTWRATQDLMVKQCKKARQNEGGIVSSARQPRRSPEKNGEPYLQRLDGIGAE